MKTGTILIAAALAAACSESAQTAQTGQGAATPTTGAAAGQTTEPVVALGLTREQLDDADIVDANGRELGDVERVMMNAGGAVTGLEIEIDDTDPDRHVVLPLDGLTPVQDGDDHDLRTTMTREQLLALPAATR